MFKVTTTIFSFLIEKIETPEGDGSNVNSKYLSNAFTIEKIKTPEGHGNWKLYLLLQKHTNIERLPPSKECKQLTTSRNLFIIIIKELAPKGDGTMAGVILRILIICLVITPPEGDGSLHYLVLSCANDVSKKKFHQRKKNSEKQLKPFQTSTI